MSNESQFQSLRAMTDFQLSRVDDAITKAGMAPIIQIDEEYVERGELHGILLWSKAGYNVNLLFCSADLTLAMHSHDEVEIIVILEGSLSLNIFGKINKMVRHDVCRIPPHTEHGAIGSEHTWMLSIRIKE